jgi:SAM-dependent methyltransferase
MREAIRSDPRKSYTYYFAGKGIHTLRNRMFDLKYNVETEGDVPLKDLKIDNPNVEHGVMYSGTDPRSFRALFKNWDIPFENFTFIDLGSGKGRVLLMASEFAFRKIRGVEFSEVLNRTAQKNIENYRNPAQKCRDIEAVWSDAASFTPPPGPLIYYMFNPFAQRSWLRCCRMSRRR